MQNKPNNAFKSDKQKAACRLTWRYAKRYKTQMEVTGT